MIWKTNHISCQFQFGKCKTKIDGPLFHSRSPSIQRLPFDWKNPFGYLIATIFLFVSLFGQFLGIIATVCLSAGFSWLLISFAESITNDVKNLKCKRTRTRNAKFVEMQKQLINIIVDLSNMKQFSWDKIKRFEEKSNFLFFFFQFCWFIQWNFRVWHYKFVSMDHFYHMQLFANLGFGISWVDVFFGSFS